MMFRRSSAVRYFIPLIFGLVIYAEVLVYFIGPLFFWPSLKCHDHSCTKILFIADPQIQGDFAAPAPLHQIYSWDSDRFLKKTFMRAINNFKPDVLVFLGDLMDEGSISTMDQFRNYIERLFDIFTVNYSVMQIWLPGDNDIGGEHEPVRQIKLKEFHNVFSQPSVLTYQNITFYKVSGILHSMPEQSEMPIEDNNFRMVLSHYCLARTVFGKQIDYKIQPNIYFCAHEHKSKLVKYSKQTGFYKIIPTKSTALNELNIVFHSNDLLYEVHVPTCSYRMGTNQIGFGAAVLGHNNTEMHYAVLWSPLRFVALFSYLVVVVAIFLYAVMYGAIGVTFKYCVRSKWRHDSSREALLS